MNFEIAPKETEAKLPWEEAMIYCQFLDYNGGGWRLPNKEELNWMYLNKTVEQKYTLRWYWSSTEYSGIYSWSHYFYVGIQFYFDKNNNYLVRAIRNKI